MAPRERKEELGTPFPPLAAGGKKLTAAPSNLWPRRRITRADSDD